MRDSKSRTISIHLASGNEGFELSAHFAGERPWSWTAEWKQALWKRKELETPETALAGSQRKSSREAGWSLSL